MINKDKFTLDQLLRTTDDYSDKAFLREFNSYFRIRRIDMKDIIYSIVNSNKKGSDNLLKIILNKTEITGYALIFASYYNQNKIELILDIAKDYPKSKKKRELENMNRIVGVTPLMMITKRGDIELVKLLLDSDYASVGYRYQKSGMTALMYAAEANNKEIVRLLLNTGKSHPELRNKESYSADQLTTDMEIRNMIRNPTGKYQDQIRELLWRPGRYISQRLFEESYPEESECIGKTTREEMISHFKGLISNMSKEKLVNFVLENGGMYDIQSVCFTDFNIANREKLIERCTLRELIRTSKLIIIRMSHQQLCSLVMRHESSSTNKREKTPNEREKFSKKTVVELRNIAKKKKLTGYSKLRKSELISIIMKS